MNEEQHIIQKPASPWNVSIKWGVIHFAASTGLYYLIHMNTDYSSVESLEATLGSSLNFIGYIFFIAALVMAQLEHRNKELHGYMSYARGMGVGAILFLVSGILSALMVYVEMGILHPEALDTIRQIRMNELMKQEMTEEQLEMSYQMMQKYVNPVLMAIGGFMQVFFFGIVFTLIVSIFTRKVNPDEI